MTLKNISSQVRAIAAAGWLIVATLLAFRDWNPAQLHYLTLFFREIPLLVEDVTSCFQKFFTDGLPQAAFSTVLLLAAAGAGRILIPVPIPALGAQVRSCIRIAAGLAFLSYITLFLGLLQLYTPAGAAIAWAVLLACAASALWQARHFPAVLKRARFHPADAVLLCFTMAVIVFLFSKALLPAVHVDAITYHLGIPNYYLLEGGIQYIPYDMYSAFPFFTEMLYTLAMLAQGQKSAQVLPVLFFAAAVISSYDFVKEFLGPGCARVAALLLLTTPCFMESSLVSGNDITLLFYVLISVWCFLLWCRDRHTLLLVLAGAFAGVCLSIKYTALTFVPILIAAGLIGDTLVRRVRPGLSLLRQSALCAGAAAAVFLPWCLKNIITTGNPVYPALYPLLGGTDMSSEMYAASQHLAAAATGNMLATAWANLSSIALFTPSLFQRCGSLGNAGLALLFFAPVVLLLRKVPLVIKALCCAACLLFLSWTMFSGIVRFFYPGLALLILVSAYALYAATRQLPAWSKPVLMAAGALCIALNCSMGLYQADMRTMTYGRDVLQKDNDSYLRQHLLHNPEALLDGYPANCFINRYLEPSACVLVIGDVQHLYLQRRHRYAYQSATTPYAPFKQLSSDHEAIAASLKRSGITHIFYNPTELVRLIGVGVVAWKQEDLQLIDDFLKSSCVQQLYVNTGSGARVYRLL